MHWCKDCYAGIHGRGLRRPAAFDGHQSQEHDGRGGGEQGRDAAETPGDAAYATLIDRAVATRSIPVPSAVAL
jgi:hypothetical protein